MKNDSGSREEGAMAKLPGPAASFKARQVRRVLECGGATWQPLVGGANSIKRSTLTVAARALEDYNNLLGVW